VRRKAALGYNDRDPDCCRRYYRNRNLVHGGYFRLGQSDVAVFGERPIMKIIHVTTGVVCGLTMLLLAPLEANAGGRKGGVRVGGHHVVSGHHARHHFRSFRNQNFGQWPFGYGYGYGYGYGDESPYTYDYSMTYPTPQTVVKPDPPQVRCQHSEQTRKVPSANGGTTEVTILRC
jgi:hypothetical protein